MAKGKRDTTISEETLAKIRADAREQKSWATADSMRPTCRCGVRRKPPGLAKHVTDDGKCVVHPDKPPERYVPGYTS